MTGLVIIGGTIALVIGAALWLNWRGVKEGRADERADNLDKGLQGFDAARKALDDARRDPAVRAGLRDKYRSR